MVAPNLAEMIAEAADRTEPGVVSGKAPAPGGVDPLGLRQINFRLMDQVFPGVNNVARHIRPFVVVAWAWRRAAEVAAESGMTTVSTSVLRDFVHRIEVIYAWSQFLRPGGADLPGRDVLADILRAGTYTFGGSDWDHRKDVRENSTSFSAAINYGPALKMLGWVEPVEDGSGALRPTHRAAPAIDAFSLLIRPHLSHPAFSHLGEVSVVDADVLAWADAWDLDEPTDVERRVMASMLAGEAAISKRALGVTLAVDAAEFCSGKDPIDVRRAMCGKPTNFVPADAVVSASEMWRRVQVRQVFRLALEALFAWTVDRLGINGTPTSRLVNLLKEAMGVEDEPTTGDWLADAGLTSEGPVELLQELQEALRPQDRAEVPSAFHKALALCLREAPANREHYEDQDRLPLALAAAQARDFVDAPLSKFLGHVFEGWLFGQHTYWAVGRGLADARSNGKQLLRLRVVMDEGGWSLTKGASAPTPLPTADRLATILSLAQEAGLLTDNIPPIA